MEKDLINLDYWYRLWLICLQNSVLFMQYYYILYWQTFMTS